MHNQTKNIFLISFAVVLLNTFVWLDSLDNYLSAQYHIALTEYFPEEIFKPSIKLKNTITNIYSNLESFNRSSIDITAPKSEQSNNTAFLKDQVRILFAGDSMMQGIAPIAISSLRKIRPQAYFEDLSKQSTGLTVNRYLDWPATIKEQIIKKNFDYVVIFLGPNDPWDIFEGKQRFKFPSPEWENKYRSRVKEVLDFAISTHVRIIWIGLPSMRDERLQTGAVIQNKIFREEMSAYGFTYISTEDLLGDLEQPFKNHILDSSGKEVVVRASDGTHFTPQGLRIISNKLVSIIAGEEAK